MPEPTITLHEHPSPDDERVVLDGLLAFNVGFLGDPRTVPIALFVRDGAGEVLGGLLGHLKWRWLYIAKFWLPEALRGQGYGSRLLREAEAYARTHDCVGAAIDTFEYQALPFYRRHGYEIVGRLDGFPPGYCQYFLRKSPLGAPDA
ncbi:MAG TPA: GNAT family N-acetyltransferase [Gemmatimonadaceae bacterium]|nr:GNAT family N-acetyltransferase [Gemmatimonadaceae bacterium]